ncbi:MAG TPA: hypothetical protein VF859_05635 [Burkholderiales bacterium]
MNSWHHRLGRLLLAVFLATLLSPHFAWEAVASDAHHHWAEDAAEAASHPEFPSGASTAQDHHDGHVCAGHQFGHLPIHMSRSFQPVFQAEATGLASDAVVLAALGFFETPLRPPRNLSFA